MCTHFVQQGTDHRITIGLNCCFVMVGSCTLHLMVIVYTVCSMSDQACEQTSLLMLNTATEK